MRMPGPGESEMEPALAGGNPTQAAVQLTKLVSYFNDGAVSFHT